MILGLGIDLAEIERFAFHATARAWFARRVFTTDEFTYAMRSRHRWPQHLAGFFAAKEALRKACGRALPWREIGVGHAESGAPILILTGSASAYVRSLNVGHTHLTITHANRTAAAVVVLESGPTT